MNFLFHTVKNHVPLTINAQDDKLTIVPVVFMARYVMILRGATSLRGALEGVGPKRAIKTTITLVVYVPECCCVMLLCVVECCCV